MARLDSLCGVLPGLNRADSAYCAMVRLKAGLAAGLVPQSDSVALSLVDFYENELDFELLDDAYYTAAAVYHAMGNDAVAMDYLSSAMVNAHGAYTLLMLRSQLMAGRRHTWLVVQLVVAAVLMAGAAVYVAATRTDPVALAYAALCAAMFVGLFRLALVAGRLGAEARRELRVGLFDVALVVFFFYGFAWLYGESWMPLTPIVFHALFLSVMLADVLRWCMEKDSRLDRPWHRLQFQGGGEAGTQ